MREQPTDPMLKTVVEKLLGIRYQTVGHVDDIIVQSIVGFLDYEQSDFAKKSHSSTDVVKSIYRMLRSSQGRTHHHAQRPNNTGLYELTVSQIQSNNLDITIKTTIHHGTKNNLPHRL